MIEAARRRLIFALDVDSCDAAVRWVEQLQDKVGLFKIGKQLFTRCGPEIVRLIQERGGQVFLDLKYHDIPNTVAQATVEACRLGVRMVNVHALGGPAMMRETAAAVKKCCLMEGLERPLLLAVTILTSSDQETLTAVGIDRPLEEMVPRLALLAQKAGLDGVVASPREVPLIRQACGPGFLVVTPGVRPAFAAVDDQKRIASPAGALSAGADYLVIGRPISNATDPRGAATAILQEMAEVLAGDDRG